MDGIPNCATGPKCWVIGLLPAGLPSDEFSMDRTNDGPIKNSNARNAHVNQTKGYKPLLYSRDIRIDFCGEWGRNLNLI